MINHIRFYKKKILYKNIIVKKKKNNFLAKFHKYIYIDILSVKSKMISNFCD